ncbi:MAG: STAS domain-containing protein [Gammaproteobacteria bacterium]|nr:STAS domain-containing protein [Gammaproteobacteria bacterium]
MECDARTEGDFTVISLQGEVDLHFSPRAREIILKHLQQKQHVLVDLSAVDYIDSSGVASLVEGFQHARTNTLKFALVGVSDAAMQILQLSRLDKVFPIFVGIDDAATQL